MKFQQDRPRPSPSGTSLPILRGGVALVALVAFGLVGACSGDKDRDFANGGGGTNPFPNGGGPCLQGTSRDCGIELGSRDGVVDCAKGTQACNADGTWGTCVANGTVTKKVAPRVIQGTPGLSTQVVGGSSTNCTDNPCNPYCQNFNDAPDSGITSDSETVILPGPTITLEASNVPGGFQNKGVDPDHRCGTASAAVACQFDMRCGADAECSGVGAEGQWTDTSVTPNVVRCCVPFTSTFLGCTGIDITAPPVCSPTDTSTFRNLTICNRGTAPLTKDIQCMGYPGNSPHYPDDSPGQGDVVLKTAAETGSFSASALPAGQCRTFTVPNSNFPSNGTESIMCNPPNVTGATTTLDVYFSVAESTTWVTPSNAADGTEGTPSTIAFGGGTTTTAVSATTTANNVNWTSPGNVTANDTAFATVQFVNGGTKRVAFKTAGTNTCASGLGCEWVASGGSSIVADLATAGDGNRMRSRLDNTSERAQMDLTGMDTSTIPAGATLTGLTIRAGGIFDGSTTGYVSIRKTAAATNLNSLTLGPVPSTTANAALTGTMVIPIATLTMADLPGMVVHADAWSSSTSNREARFGHILADVTYGGTVSSATMDVSGFAAPTIPAGATIVSYTIETDWKIDAGNASEVLGIRAYTPGGVALGAEKTATFATTYAANTETTSTLTWTAADAGGTLTAADFANGFKVALRGARVTDGVSADPDFTMSVDNVRLKVAYATGLETGTITLSGFGFQPPAGATNITLTTFARIKSSNTTADQKITFANYKDGGATLLNTASVGPNISTTSTTYQLGPVAIANANDLSDANLRVKAVATGGTSAWIANLDWVMARITYIGSVTGQVAECNSSNNWTVSKSNPATLCTPMPVTTYPPWTTTRIFEGVCPSGSIPVWKRFGYTSSTPAGTSVEFRFRTFAKNADGTCPTTNAAVTTSPPVPLATAKLLPDTQSCSVTATGTGACPVLLDSVGTNPCLQMDAYGIPAAAPAASPTLSDWRVTYDCIPQE